MHLDVRLPIGLMFTLFGVVLAAFGAFANQKVDEQRYTAVNINLYWGLVLLAFGLVMLALVARARKHAPRS